MSTGSPLLGPSSSSSSSILGGLPLGSTGFNTSGGSGAALPSSVQSEASVKEIYALVQQLLIPEQREYALSELSKKRETFPDLAPILWYSYGTVAALLQEIISIYSLLSPPTLTPQGSNRVCNALALLQCVASHPETKLKLMHAYIPLYLYPFLNTISRQRPFEYLRLTSLGVIGALVKVDDTDVVNFLLQTEIIPLCLRIMENGSELSKTVATFIIQKILLDNNGLAYVCSNPERFYAISNVLTGMVAKLIETPSSRLLKHIVRCYLRLSENAKAREALRMCLPDSLKDQTFGNLLRNEEAVQRWLAILHKNLATNTNSAPGESVSGGELGFSNTTRNTQGSMLNESLPTVW